MRKLESFKADLDPKQYPVGRSVTYVDPAKTFSVECRVAGYDGTKAVLLPSGDKKPIEARRAS
jgi:hypothetical protein